MLGTLEEYQKGDWKAHVPTMVHALNPTFHEKVSKGAKIRNRYNQVSHLTQDTNRKVTDS